MLLSKPTLGELWAIPIMLRLGLLENLRDVVERVTAGRKDRETAAEWIDRMLTVAATAPANVVLMLAMILVYVMTDSLSLRPGKRAIQSTPAAAAP